MVRRCWTYRADVPIIEVTFEPRRGRNVTLTLQVDTGAIGDVHFSLSEADSQRLRRRQGPDVRVTDVSGNVIVRHTVWVIVNMPDLGLRRWMLVVCYPQAPGIHEGLARLAFLDAGFDVWGSERDAARQRQFCVQRT